jgi:hypothetical protein
MNPKHLRRTGTPRAVARAAAVATTLALAVTGVAAPALAGKPQAGGKPTAGSSSTLNLVLLNSTDGLPHHGQDVTFEASSSSTTEPHVKLACSQGGTVVYNAQTGYFASYPWPWTNTMKLSSGAWTGGAASCTATLYWFSGSKTVTGKTLNFPVYA